MRNIALILRKLSAKVYIALLRFALNKAHSQICPSLIPRSGESGASIRCYSTRIIITQKITCLVTATHENHIDALAYDDVSDRMCLACSVPIKLITPRSLEITQYYGYYTIDYLGLWKFIVRGLSGYESLIAKFKITNNSIAQFFFNKRKLQSKRRIELLSFLVNTYAESSENIRLIYLMSRLHTNRWVYHPEKETHKKYLNLYLSSFVESGELISQDALTYKLTGKAIVTLENFEDQERKHRDNLIIQRIMVILTIALAFLATVQAGLIKLPTLISLT